MTSRLRQNPDDLEALVRLTAAATQVPAAHIEKDFWVTEVLRIAARNRDIEMPDGTTEQVTFIFKGGTSLSRVFNIVERFSEDVDLLANFPAGSKPKARHRLLKQVDADVASHLGLALDQVEVSQSTTGVKRYTTYPYRTDQAETELKEGVLLELGSRGGTHPSAKHSYRSMVAEHAINVLHEDPDTWEEFASFPVDVLAPE